MFARLTRDKVIEKVCLIHGDFFIFDKMVYVNAHTKMEIICPIHGSFLINANNLIYNKRGCKKCSNDKKAAAKFLTQDEFVRRSRLVHGDKYDYSRAQYTYATEDVEIICPIHGSFWQIANKHYDGDGCPKCWHDRMSNERTYTREEFIDKANIVHNRKYDYSRVNYIDSFSKIEIICPMHGSFWKQAASHLRGSGCNKCSYGYRFKENKWLDYVGVPDDKDHRQVRLVIGGKVYRVDGIDPNNNIVYEFYGDFWHGNLNRYNTNDINSTNKKSFGELYLATMTREEIIKSAGFRLITIWETDFDKLNGIIK